MSIKKSALSAAIAAAVFGSVTMGANAMTTSDTLVYTNGNVGNFGSAAAAGASWFSMQVGPTTTIFTGMQVGTDGGVAVNGTQGLPAGVFSHASMPYGGTYTSDTGAIDTGWGFFGNTGLHFTTTPTINSGTVSGSTLDFSGWRVAWNTIASINMGGGTQVVTGKKGSTTYMNGTGLATVTCSSVACVTGDSFTLSYNAFVPQGDASGFGGVYYAVELTGYVNAAPSAVPVPAAVWLFGSGMMGLAAVARRKKKA